MRIAPRSLALRTALGSAAAVFGVCLLLFAVIVVLERRDSREIMLAQVDGRLRDELDSVRFKDDLPSLEHLQRALLDREADFKDGIFVLRFALLAPDGSNLRVSVRDNAGDSVVPPIGNAIDIAGLVARMPLRLAPWAGATDAKDPQTACLAAPEQVEVRVCGTLRTVADRPDRVHLLVAQVIRASHTTGSRDAMWPLATGMAATLAAASLGYLASRRLERRLAQVSTAAEAVMAGDLTRRMPEQGTGDEFDRLVGTVNAVLNRVEALVAGIRQVTENIAHDLRTPLQRMHQALERALERPRDPQADAETLDIALAELGDILATFSALLRIAGVEAAAAMQGAPATLVDLSALVAWLGETYLPVAEAAGQRLELAVAAPGLMVRGDLTLLRQAGANLVQNALLHGGPEVQVHLAAAPTPEGGCSLEVCDNGPGIPAAEHEKVLGRFYRLDRSRSTPGTGLGLSLVAVIAALHGAQLTLGDARSGLRVTLVFPPVG